MTGRTAPRPLPDGGLEVDWPDCWGAAIGTDRLDLGAGVTARRILYGPHNIWIGLVEQHPRPDTGAACSGFILFGVPAADDYARHYLGGKDTRWEVQSWDPLSITPSVACRACPQHGYITGGRWV